LRIGNYFAISFLRGQLINHGTPPQLLVIQSNPIAPVIRENRLSMENTLTAVRLAPLMLAAAINF